MKRYRYVTRAKQKGRWKATREAARIAAAKAGHGSIDDQGRVWLDVMVEIEVDPPR